VLRVQGFGKGTPKEIIGPAVPAGMGVGTNGMRLLVRRFLGDLVVSRVFLAGTLLGSKSRSSLRQRGRSIRSKLAVLAAVTAFDE
jgi:hypothetical protein